MELELNKEPVFISEVIFDGQTEQGVEFDYVLPDYYPDIFKILNFTLTPGIVSYNVSGTQLHLDGVAHINVMYLSENSTVIHCVEHKYTYSKTVDLVRSGEKHTVSFAPKVDYCNCRAVSGRRLDMRGAVSYKIRVTDVKQTEMISHAEGLEMKKMPITYCGDKLVASRQFAVREDIETGMGKGGIQNIIHRDAVAEVTDIKVIANKVVVKGEVKLKALYLVKNADDKQDSEVMEAVIPVSQIIDVDGIDDGHVCYVRLSVMDCDLDIKANEMGENRMFGCDMMLDCTITASKENTISLLTDVYSTQYETAFTKSTIKTEYSPQVINRQLSLKSELQCGEGELTEVFDGRCEISNVMCRVNEEGTLVVTGQCAASAMGRLENGAPVFLEKSEPFEISAESVGEEGCAIEPDLQVGSVSYSITGDNNVELRIILELNGCLFGVRSVEAINEIEIDTEKPKEKNNDYALKLYFAEENEEIFAIAKHYNTSAAAIMAENELEAEVTAEPCMLLIPIV